MQKALFNYSRKKSSPSDSSAGAASYSFGGVLLLCCLVLTAGAFAMPGEQADSHTRLELDMRQAIGSSAAADAVWSVAVRDETGRLVAEVDPARMHRIASNSKLFVAAGLLLELGPDFRHKTRIYGDGRLDEHGVWQGDLHIIGSGDPSIDGHFYDDDAFYVFDAFIEQLREAGIESVHGNIFGNDGLFDDLPYPRGWEWDDLSYYYAPELGALSFNRNCVDLTVRADGEVGSTPAISWFPYDTDYVTFVNEQTITPSFVAYDESYRRVLGTNTILLRSTLPQGYLEEESLSIAEPAAFFLDSFQKHAMQRGLPIRGELIPDRVVRERQDFQLLATHTSEPLHKLLHRVNRESDNFYTEMLVKTLSAAAFGPGGSSESGLEYVELILEENLRLSTRSLRLRDASGMASANVASASALTALLHRMYGSPHGDEWKQTLSRAGYYGTLENRFLASPALGNLYGKTGFITGVRTLSGYITAESGQTYSFSILTNNHTQSTGTVDAVHERIINLIYERL